STTRWLGGGPVGKPAASTHSRTVRPAGKASLTEISPARARPSGAVHRARTQERPESSMAGGTAACSQTAGTGPPQTPAPRPAPRAPPRAPGGPPAPPPRPRRQHRRAGQDPRDQQGREAGRDLVGPPPQRVTVQAQPACEPRRSHAGHLRLLGGFEVGAATV